MKVMHETKTVQWIKWFFIFQPNLPKTDAADVDDYDSADSAVSDLDEDEEEEDVFDNNEAAKREKRRTQENTEHSNPFSYSWSIIRLAVLRLVQLQLQEFLGIAGLEIQGNAFVLLQAQNYFSEAIFEM